MIGGKVGRIKGRGSRSVAVLSDWRSGIDGRVKRKPEAGCEVGITEVDKPRDGGRNLLQVVMGKERSRREVGDLTGEVEEQVEALKDW